MVVPQGVRWRLGAAACALALCCISARTMLAQLRPTLGALADALSSWLVCAGRERRCLGRRRRGRGASGKEAEGVSAPSCACTQAYSSRRVVCVECSRVLASSVHNCRVKLFNRQ